MGGIVGYYGSCACEQCNDALLGMMQRISHRGSGFKVSSFDSFTIGSVQLKETSLSNDQEQHKFLEKRKYILALDGVIYNIDSVADELRQCGVCDNKDDQLETVLLALLTWGIKDAVRKFDGMFAFVFYDNEKQSLWLGRDRLGIKPLYYWSKNGSIIFSSEIKAILTHKDVHVEPDVMMVLQYLQEDTVNRNRTLFRGICVVEPGTVIEYKKSVLSKTTYYDPIDELDYERLTMKESSDKKEQIINELDWMIKNSVKIQAEKTERIGVLCSGGVDSALLCAYAKTCNIDFSMYVADVEGAYPEKEKASFVANRLKKDIRIASFSDKDFLKCWPSTVWHSDQPTIFQSDPALYYLLSFCRAQDVKNVLVGEGSDELFCGYRWYLSEYGNVDEYKGIMPQTNHNFYRYRQMLSTYDQSLESWNMRELGSMYLFADERIHRFETLYMRLSNYVDGNESIRLSRQLVDLYDRLSMLLHRADRMGMASSVNCRAPYLSNNIVEYTSSLPYWCKYQKGTDKPIIREIASRYLPLLVANNPKRAFAVRGDVYRFCIPLVYRGFIAQLLQIEKNTEDIVLHDVLKGNYNQSFLYRLGCLELWGRIYINGESPEALGLQLCQIQEKYLYT